MNVTELGAHSLELSASERKHLAHKLLEGDFHIYDYVRFGKSHDVVAYIRFLFNASITVDELLSTNGEQWQERFQFQNGDRQWYPGMNIDEGKAIGFYRHSDGKFYHSAVSVGHETLMKSVHGGLLGSEWMDVDLDTVLTDYNKEDGSFDWDGTKLEVYISDL
ncbi:hypothetical protein [Ulvibacter litoralis]|uniref:Uncharacterized protein n=1 Tax=Ulvibacter litoralis TaxID=227084 RepID=A0A1G7FTQ0_9FLAO|nr:hypothetical protein [Ulvibacter litoralis]GHC63510.1 hypothetical protein GCM10008083_30950 [Ulvibacter litoralis]SDE79293.1 hypothetical protein SAMN05421855_102774 [Ulvibacter litoralis]